MPQHKNQHILAQSYLKHFTADDNPYSDVGHDAVWIFDRTDSSCRLKGVKNVLSEPYYYSLYGSDGAVDNRIEIGLGKVENAFQSVVKKTIQSVNRIKTSKAAYHYTPHERAAAAAFIVWQLKRTPKFRSMIFRDYIEKQYQIEEKNLQALKRSNPTLYKTIMNEVMTSIRFIGTRKEANFFRLLLTKSWVIFYLNPKDGAIITCDDPVLITNNDGLNGLIYQNTEIAIPITKQIVLTLYRVGADVEFRPIQTRKLLRKINIGLARNSTRFLVGSSKALLKNVGKYCSVASV